MDFGDLVNDAKIKEKLLNLHSSIDEIEKVLETATKFSYEDLTQIEKVNYDLFNMYTLNVLCWMYLRTRGQDPGKSNIKEELTRIRMYMLKAKEVQDKAFRPKIDQSAAGRFIKRGLNYTENAEGNSKTKKRKYSKVL